MNDIREGSIDLAGQTINLEDLDDAYEKDYDTDGLKDQEGQDIGSAQDNNQSGDPFASSGLPSL
jgi:hypothetical protein